MIISPKTKRIISVGSGFGLLFLLLHLGCGYQLAGNLNLPPHVKSIAVPIFQNQTTEPDIEKLLTEAVIERLQSLGQLRITTVDKADAVLYGIASDYEARIALSFDKDFRVKEYRLKITARIELKDAKSDQVIWGKQKLTAKAEYLVGEDVLATQDAEKEAQKTAAFELARDLITRWEGLY